MTEQISPAQDGQISQEEFIEVMAKFIDQANEMTNDYPAELINTALTYAASRYSAFIAARTSDSLENLTSEEGSAINYFTEMYKAMLQENLLDYKQNYSDYMSK